MFGGRNRIAIGRVHHDDAARGRRFDVDVVNADACSADDAQLSEALSIKSAADFRFAANNHAVKILATLRLNASAGQFDAFLQP